MDGLCGISAVLLLLMGCYRTHGTCMLNGNSVTFGLSPSELVSGYEKDLGTARGQESHLHVVQGWDDVCRGHMSWGRMSDLTCILLHYLYSKSLMVGKSQQIQSTLGHWTNQSKFSQYWGTS